MKILLVEDDQPTAAVLSEVLTAQCYTVELAKDGQTGLACATTADFDLILLDLLIPKLDGISLCQQLRAQGYQKPILLLTAKDFSIDVVKGLDAGADDYVTKPYDLSELLARIRALLRRGETDSAPNLLTWEKLCINPVSAEVIYDHNIVPLTPKEYGLLGLFLRNPQRVFSRGDIIDRLWSIDTTPSEGAVTNLIKDLRQKLKASGMVADLLETVYGLGYRLKAAPATQEVFTALKTTAPETTAPETTTLTKTRQKDSETKKKTRQEQDWSGVNQVLQRYQNTFTERVVALEQIEHQLRAGILNQTLQQNAAQEAHRLVGALGSFGYGAGSELARSIEHLLSHQPLQPTNAPYLATLLAQLKQQLAQPPHPLTLNQIESAQIPLVLVVDQEESFTDQLQHTAFAWGIQVKVATNFATAKQQIARSSPHAVLVSLEKATGATLATLSEFRQQFPNLSVLVIAAQDSLDDRVVMSHLGIQRFLYKPLSTAQVFEAIAQVLPKPQSAGARVMILDDDAIVLNAFRNLLQPWGLQVTTLQEPKQFWKVLTATTPDLLILDLEMPTSNGIDLCRVVRQDPKWGDLPILVVTAHTHRESIQKVFAAGADDFIGKPVVGPELVTRVISHIDRTRLQQELETMKRRIGKRL